jgi:hypothetical protein
LFNAMLNPVYVLAAGGLAGALAQGAFKQIPVAAEEQFPIAMHKRALRTTSL